MKISPARITAFEILSKIASDKAFSAVLLPFYEEKLSPKDRALVHELTLGILRKQLYLDRIIELLTKKKIGKFDAEVLVSLRMGLYQILFLDKIPHSAAVNESVNLVQKAKKTSAKGLVNAILRKASREKIEPTFESEVEKLSIENSHPRWLVEKWTKDFGIEETEKLLKANNETPRLVFRLTAKSAEKTVETLKKLGLDLEESQIIAGAWIVKKPNEMLYAYARQGKIYFQEESSQLVGSLIKLGENQRFFDVCAAPGSKTTFAALQNAHLENRRIFAGDRHRNRTKFLRENCRKQGAKSVAIAQYDAEDGLPFAADSFDLVLVDAPCSGTGTLRHNPEIRYSLTEKDLEDLTKKQLEILENASNVLKKGGNLIYSTCSLENEENEKIVNDFLRRNPKFQKRLPDLPPGFLTKEGFARTFPHRDKTDGFFIAKLEKS